MILGAGTNLQIGCCQTTICRLLALPDNVFHILRAAVEALSLSLIRHSSAGWQAAMPPSLQANATHRGVRRVTCCAAILDQVHSPTGQVERLNVA